MRLYRSLGWLDLSVRYTIDDRIGVWVPLALRSYDAEFVADYEEDVVKQLALRTERMRGGITLVDCGADIGLMSCKLAARIKNVERIFAFEPSEVSFPHLQRNLEAIPIETLAINSAVSDFVGVGALRFPLHDPESEHARFLVKDPLGSVSVTRIDDLGIPGGGNLLMKIDVEGAELQVVNGAERTISTAGNFALMFEAHKGQVMRSGIDPGTIVSRIASFAAIKASVAELPSLSVDWGKPFFDQIPFASGNAALNVIVTKDI